MCILNSVDKYTQIINQYFFPLRIKPCVRDRVNRSENKHSENRFIHKQVLEGKQFKAVPDLLEDVTCILYW